MKKEKTDIIVTVVLLAIIILGVAAYLCIKNGVFDHKHKYNTQEILPTCTEEGYTLHKCKKCEDSYVDNIVQPTGHNYYIKSTISPTCIENGKTIIGCQNCDFEKERIIDSIGHVFGDDLICDNCGFEAADHEHTFVKSVIEPKCTTLGYTLYKCDCGYSFRDDYIESTGHYFNNGTILKHSTCDSAGLIEYECILCQETYQYILEPSHLWNVTIIQVHTCTTDGINRKECINCGVIEEEIIPAGHNFIHETIIFSPTCTEEGYKEGYCSSCRKTIGEFIPKIPHEYIDGICVYCGKSMYDDVVNNSHIDYGYYFNFEDVLTMYGPDYIDEYGTYLDFNDDAVVQKVGVYLIQEGNYWKRAIACVGSNIKYATAVPYLANDKQIKYSGLNSEWIYIFNLNENEDGIWCYDNFATITSTLSDREGNRLLSLYNIGIAGNNTRIFDNLPEMIEWLKETECITHTEGRWIYDVLPTCEEDGLRHTECKRCKETIQEEIIEKLGHQFSDDLTYNSTHHWYPSTCGHSELEILIEHKIEYKNVLPTCADYGYDLYSCECGYNYKENYVDKLEHVIVFDMHQDSTCSQEGFDKYKCINCTYEYKNYIAKIPHNYTMSVVDPTCEHEGYDLYKCHCGESYKLNLVSRLPHEWEFDIEVQSTCTIQGYTRYMCSECRQTYYNYYEKLPHEYLKTSIVQPTCHRQGYTKHTCECGHSYNDNYVNKLEHKWQLISSTESTCTTQGVDKYECSLCKDTQNHYKDKLPHNYIYKNVIDPTCSAQGYTKYTCECGHYIYDNYTNKLPHETYIDLDTDSTCTTKGKTVYKCENCSYSNTEYKQLLPHKYTSETYDPTCTEDGYTKHTCECGYSYNSNIKNKLGHDYKESVLTYPTCENKGLSSYDCSRCDSYYEAATPALGHDLEEIEELPSCTVDGATLINCLRCDYQKIIPIPSTGHSYQKSIISPTCTEQGYTIYKCHCGSSYNSDYTSPKGHSTKTTIIIEPTCTTEGKSKTSCTKCSYSYETILSKTAHKYEQVTIQSTCTQEGYTAKQCSCGDKEILSIIPIKAHNTYVYSQKESTCTEEGYTIHKCYNCDYYKTEIVERKAHSYKTTTIKPTCTEEGQVLKTCICGESYISEYLPKIPHSFKDDVCSMCGLYFYDQFVFESGELTIYNGESEYIEIPSYYYENGIKTKVTSVGTAFKENEKIKEIIIREGIEYIRPNAFEGCISLEKVILPTSIKGIGSRAFMNCYSLEELNLPYGIEYLDSHLVDNCEKLTNITIPSSVETLNSSAFIDCPNLTIYVPLSESKETWSEEWYKNVKEVIWNSNNEYQITYDLNGGYYDIKVNKVIQTFTVNCYHTYVEGKISIVDKESPEFNYYIALEKMDVEGIYKINYVGEEVFSSYDLLIAWNNTVSDSALQEIWDFGASYLATYVVMNLPSESSFNADINVKIAELYNHIEAPKVIPSYIKGNEFILPIPIKNGYNFLGWYNEDTKVEKITSDTTGNLELIAKWEKILVENEIIFDLNGGQLEGYTYDSFIENVIELFNASDEPGSKVVTKEKFHSTSHPNINDVYNKAENLEAHKWLFEFVKAEILALGADNVYVKETVEMLDKMIAGDTTAIKGRYPNGRTLLRHFIHNLINKNHEAVNSAYTEFIPDFTLEENQIKASKVMKNIKDVYQVGDQLPIAYKEGYKFLGWELNGQIITKANTELKGNLTLIARYEDEKIEGNEILVGQTRTYKTLAEALAAAKEGDIIVLDSGEYALGEVINKSVTIKGPNADLAAPAVQNPEAIINVTKDVAGNLAAANIEFNGVHLVGTGGGAGTPGIFFQDGGNVESLKFKSCVISDMNTFVKFTNGGSNLDLVIEECRFYKIGQFIVWTTKSINKTFLLGNVIDGNTCGAVTNTAAALFRIRTGSLEAYNNVFNGDSANTPGYFECSAQQSFVKYNVFNGVRLFVHPTANNNIVFDKNMYISIGGSVLEAAPAELVGGGTITADKTVCKNAEELPNAYNKYLLTQYLGRYFNISFDAAGGKFVGSYPVFYDSEAGIDSLPAVERNGYIFQGWLLDGKVVESIPAGTTGELKLVASWEKDCLVVDGTTEDGHFATLADALAAAKEGDTIILGAGSYEGAEITINNITINGANAGINPNREKRGAESVFLSDLIISANDITIDGIQITGNARIMGGANGCENIYIYNVWSKGATTNPYADSDSNAPFYFYSTIAGSEYRNLVFSQIKMSDRQDARPMVAYFNQVMGLTITDSNFIGRRSNFNNAIVFAHGDNDLFGIKGVVNITGNYFDNFEVIPILIAIYLEGEYNFAYNTFRNCGIVTGNPAIRFGTYNGDINGISEINVHDNILDYSFALIHLLSNSNRTTITQPVKVNYNLVVDHLEGYIIINENQYNIDGTNNIYYEIPRKGMFKNTIWEPYLRFDSDYFNDNYGKIIYELNDGSFDITPQMYYIKDLYALPTPTKEGLTFLGWYDNPYFAGEALTEVHATGIITLYAKYGTE